MWLSWSEERRGDRIRPGSEVVGTGRGCGERSGFWFVDPPRTKCVKVKSEVRRVLPSGVSWPRPLCPSSPWASSSLQTSPGENQAVQRSATPGDQRGVLERVQGG